MSASASSRPSACPISLRRTAPSSTLIAGRSPARREVERTARIDARDQPEPLAKEQHVRHEGALSPKVVLMRPTPGGERAVILAFVKGKGCVDLVETPLRQLDRLDHRHRNARAVAHHPSFADMRFRPLARRPAGCPLLARQHQPGELVGQFRAVPKRELFQRPPVMSLSSAITASPPTPPPPS